jgi:hypothetical protein
MSEKNDPADIGAGPDENSSGKRVHCTSCGKDFADCDSYLDHVYDDERCYKAYLASDRNEMGKE